MRSGPSLVIKPYARSDRDAVVRMLSFLPSLYPDGMQWLLKRLDDVAEGRAFCSIAWVDSSPAGIAIETPKSPSTVKLSTFWISEGFRRRGIASRLLTHCKEGWRRNHIKNVYLTADTAAALQLGPFLGGFGFRIKGMDANRYGLGRDEIIFDWVPDNDNRTDLHLKEPDGILLGS